MILFFVLKIFRKLFSFQVIFLPSPLDLFLNYCQIFQSRRCVFFVEGTRQPRSSLKLDVSFVQPFFLRWIYNLFHFVGSNKLSSENNLKIETDIFLIKLFFFDLLIFRMFPNRLRKKLKCQNVFSLSFFRPFLNAPQGEKE